jgi:hypothetical protein
VFYCDYHQRYEPIGGKFGEITMHDGKKVVCKDAKRELVQCEDCGVYFKRESGKRICDKCFENYDSCEVCGQLVKKDKLHTHDGKKCCDECLSILKSGFGVLPKEKYDVDDYVLMRDNIHCCEYGSNDMMQRYYANRIVRITRKSRTINAYDVTQLDNNNWGWSANCFVGAVVNCKPEYVGKTLQEVLDMIREENANEN